MFNKNNKQIEELVQRIVELENKIDFLFRNLGINNSIQAPEVEIPPQVEKFIREGNKIAAIKEFKKMTGAGLKDAKIQIEKWEKQLR
ncbi:MAG: hypothetical protein PF689_01440 [Deltaproteobacteria bacterium]|jgi:ribosomal protein L7/L12|nr:hypothetical protein [Deltaproteobacteria bacterium]